MRTSRFLVLCLPIVALAACSKKEQAPDTTAMAPAAMPAPIPAPAPIALSQVAGTWNMVSHPTSGADTSATTYVLVATADTTGWTMKPQGEKAVKVQVRADGDSIMLTTGTYQSLRRKGAKVFTTSVHRLQDGKLVGMTTAHYDTKGADSVLVLHTESTKAP